MASGLIFDPIQLLRVAPLATSTGSLVYATSELLHNHSFLQPSIRKDPSKVKALPTWYSYVFNRGVIVVLTLNLSTISASAANILLDRRRLGASVTGLNPLSRTTFYWAGLVAAIGHLVFVPWVAGPVQRIVEDEEGENAPGEMEKWLGVHKVRMLVADFPAWLAFIGAAMLA